VKHRRLFFGLLGLVLFSTACGGLTDDYRVVPCEGERAKFCGPGSHDTSPSAEPDEAPAAQAQTPSQTRRAPGTAPAAPTYLREAPELPQDFASSSPR
jgi:hypothetical protein